jgi:hypothetical protein
MNVERLIAFTQALVRQPSLSGEEGPVVALVLAEVRSPDIAPPGFLFHSLSCGAVCLPPGASGLQRQLSDPCPTFFTSGSSEFDGMSC